MALTRKREGIQDLIPFSRVARRGPAATGGLPDPGIHLRIAAVCAELEALS